MDWCYVSKIEDISGVDWKGTAMPMDYSFRWLWLTLFWDVYGTDLDAWAQTWCNYKHYNTVKFLIGLAPQGVITYISKGWRGRVSDVHLTENSGLLDNLNLILADLGFSAFMYYAKVILAQDKKHLSQEKDLLESYLVYESM